MARIIFNLTLFVSIVSGVIGGIRAESAPTGAVIFFGVFIGGLVLAFVVGVWMGSK